METNWDDIGAIAESLGVIPNSIDYGSVLEKGTDLFYDRDST